VKIDFINDIFTDERVQPLFFYALERAYRCSILLANSVDFLCGNGLAGVPRQILQYLLALFGLIRAAHFTTANLKSFLNFAAMSRQCQDDSLTLSSIQYTLV